MSTDLFIHRPDVSVFLKGKQIIPLLSAFLIACTPFSTSFEEVEENRVRTIDFIYRNHADTALCEAAPGDTFDITALFSGEEVRDIAITASFKVTTSLYGQSHALDEQPLDYTTIYSSLKQTGDTDCDTFSFRFAVPPDFLLTSPFLPEENWINEIPEDLHVLYPSSFTSRTKSEVITLLHLFSERLPHWDSLTYTDFTEDSLYQLYLNDFLPSAVPILQLFSALVQLNVTVNDKYNIVSYGTVRYHRLFTHLQSIRCNTNPRVTRMGIYRVKENNITYFDPQKHSQKYEPILLYDSNSEINSIDYTLQINKNESYFLFVESDTPEQTLSISGSPTVENHMYEWFFQQDQSDTDELEPGDLGNTIYNASDGPIVPLFISESGIIKNCLFWIQVRDEAIGPRLYPTGSSVLSTRIQFEYSPDFLD